MHFDQIDFSGKPFAILEIVVMLGVAASLGYILARLIFKSRLVFLKEEIELKQIDLAECRAIIPKKMIITEPSSAKIVKMTLPLKEIVPEAPDDLKMIEGVGPKIEEILNKHGISTFLQLSGLTPVRIATILRSAGPRYQIHDPSSWPEQAALAQQGKWEELEQLKIKLISGINSKSK